MLRIARKSLMALWLLAAAVGCDSGVAEVLPPDTSDPTEDPATTTIAPAQVEDAPLAP